jgi:lactoylglutathione lyase
LNPQPATEVGISLCECQDKRQVGIAGVGVEQITRINHVGLRVRDLASARTFYEKLGFEFMGGPMGPEPVAIMEHPSGVNINFILNASSDASPINVLMDEAVKHTGFTHIALEISNAEEVKRQLNEHGIAITELVEYEGAMFFFVRDPDGNVIEFHRPAS